MTDLAPRVAAKTGWGVAGMLAAAQFIMVLDTTVMNVSISQVVEDLDTTIVGLQTAITMYTLVMASFMLIGGKFGERWGAKRAFWVGLLVYGTGSFLTSVAPNLAVLLIGWSFIEGMGAVLVIPAIAALTAATYQGKQRAIAYGILGGVSGASMAAGPLIGGWVSAYLSWRYVFAAESVVVLVILLFLRIIPAVQARKTKLDTGGAVLSALGLGSIVLGILRSSQWGWITPSQNVPEINGKPLTPLGLSPTLWLILVGAILLVVFGRRERTVKDRGDEPLLDLALLKIPRMRAGLVVQWCQAFIIQATFFVLPLYLQTVLGFDSLKTGVTILPMSVAMFVFALGGSALTGRFSPKLIVQRGIAAMLVGEVVLLYFLDPQLSGWGFGGRPGAARRRPRAAGLPSGQRDHVLGRTDPRRRGRRTAGHLAQPRRLSRRRARRLDPPRHTRVQLHQRGPGKHVAPRLGQAAGHGRRRRGRQLRVHQTGRTSRPEGWPAGGPDRRGRGHLLRRPTRRPAGRPRLPGALRAARTGLGATPADVTHPPTTQSQSRPPPPSREPAEPRTLDPRVVDAAENIAAALGLALAIEDALEDAEDAEDA